MKWIKEETGYEGVIDVWVVDLSEFDSVREFIEGAVGPKDSGEGGAGSGGLERLDLVVLNAGVAHHTDLKYIHTKDGFEET